MKKILAICGVALLFCSFSVSLAIENSEKVPKVKIVDDLQFEMAAFIKEYTPVVCFSPAEFAEAFVLNCPGNKLKVEETKEYASPFVDRRYIWEYEHQFNC